MTYDQLIECGRWWLGKVTLQADVAQCDADRNALMAQMNPILQPLGIRVGRGWQPRDPVVRHGRPHSYMALMQTLDHDAANNAAALLDFARGHIDVAGLPSPLLRELAVIVCFAEVGRGYGKTEVEAFFNGFVADVANGEANWTDVKAYYPAARTAQEDDARDWTLEAMYPEEEEE